MGGANWDVSGFGLVSKQQVAMLESWLAFTWKISVVGPPGQMARV
jgi:hypothetical protein